VSSHRAGDDGARGHPNPSAGPERNVPPAHTDTESAARHTQRRHQWRTTSTCAGTLRLKDISYGNHHYYRWRDAVDLSSILEQGANVPRLVVHPPVSRVRARATGRVGLGARLCNRAAELRDWLARAWRLLGRSEARAIDEVQCEPVVEQLVDGTELGPDERDEAVGVTRVGACQYLRRSVDTRPHVEVRAWSMEFDPEVIHDEAHLGEIVAQLPGENVSAFLLLGLSLR
jgi:hypothetical protein